MRKLIILSFITLDGVMQAPGGPQEDTSGGFKWGGWTVPFFDEALGEEMTDQMAKPFDLLLGRKTFEIFACYWPDHKEDGKEINNARKYVVSTTLKEHVWEKSVFISKSIPEEIEKLKQLEGPDIQVHGSHTLIQTLLKHDLADELWLKIFPVTIGAGKKLFTEGTIPASFKLTHSRITQSGVIIASYARDGEIKMGSF